MTEQKRIIIVLVAIAMSLASVAQTSLKKVYDESIDPVGQIDEATMMAKQTGRFVICQVGGNWCPWCLRFADFISNDSTISNIISENFVYIHVNYNPRRSADEITVKQTSTMLNRLNNPQRFGFPVFVVLNSEGKVIHIQDSSFLEEDKSYSREKVIRFFRNWTPDAVNN